MKVCAYTVSVGLGCKHLIWNLNLLNSPTVWADQNSSAGCFNRGPGLHALPGDIIFSWLWSELKYNVMSLANESSGYATAFYCWEITHLVFGLSGIHPCQSKQLYNKSAIKSLIFTSISTLCVIILVRILWVFSMENNRKKWQFKLFIYPCNSEYIQLRLFLSVLRKK